MDRDETIIVNTCRDVPYPDKNLYTGSVRGIVEVYRHRGNAQPYSIVVHKETGVMYIKGGSIAVMVDENGKPLLWENWESEDTK